MYRVPFDINLDGIIGSEVEMIACGRFSVHFHFHSGHRIRAQGAIQVVQNGNVSSSWVDESQWSSVAFQELLNLPVIRYSVPNDRLLQIDFENGYSLHLHDDSDQYETMLIEPGCIVI